MKEDSINLFCSRRQIYKVSLTILLLRFNFIVLPHYQIDFKACQWYSKSYFYERKGNQGNRVIKIISLLWDNCLSKWHHSPQNSTCQKCGNYPDLFISHPLCSTNQPSSTKLIINFWTSYSHHPNISHHHHLKYYNSFPKVIFMSSLTVLQSSCYSQIDKVDALFLPIFLRINQYNGKQPSKIYHLWNS